MKVAYLDCFSGISGNMLLGAILDAGWPVEELEAVPQRLGLEGVRLDVCSVLRQGLRGEHVSVRVDIRQPVRDLRAVSQVLSESDFPSAIRDQSLAVFQALASAEAQVHGQEVDEVHFHEVGAVDTLVDVVGCVSGLAAMGVAQISCSPLPSARGWVRCAHGTLPVPAPATVALLEGLPTYGAPGDSELVTPTGAALVRVLAASFGPLPKMTVEATGYGAGSRDLASHANLLRLWLGESTAWAEAERVVEIRTHVDDMNPEWYEYLMERLWDAGALDVAMAPLQMKRNRPGVALTVIAPLGGEEALCEILLRESTTIGLRLCECARRILPRSLGTVPTSWGRVCAKLITRPGDEEVIYPEYKSCREVARRTGLPLAQVYQAVAQTPVESFQLLKIPDGTIDACARRPAEPIESKPKG